MTFWPFIPTFLMLILLLTLWVRDYRAFGDDLAVPLTERLITWAAFFLLPSVIIGVWL